MNSLQASEIALGLLVAGVVFTWFVRRRMHGEFLDFYKKRVLGKTKKTDWLFELRLAFLVGMAETLLFFGFLFFLRYVLGLNPF